MRDLRKVFEANHVKRQDGCWEWTGLRDRKEYGRIRLSGNRTTGAHRFALQEFKSVNPGSMLVLHSCDHPWCVNPDHLRVGTAAENSADMCTKRREAWGEAHGSNKLSAEQVLEIVTLYGSGQYTQREISQMFRVAQPTVSKLWLAQRWKRLL